MPSIDTYAIGAEIGLNMEIVGQLERVADQFGVIQGSVDRINTGLRAMDDLVSGITGKLGAMASGFSGAADAAGQMGAGSAPGMGRAPSGAGFGSTPYTVNGADATPSGASGALIIHPGTYAQYMGPGGPGTDLGPAYAPQQLYLPAPEPERGGVPARVNGYPYYSGDDGNTFYRSGYTPNWVPGGAGGGGGDEPPGDEPFPSPMPPINPGGRRSGGIDPMETMGYIFTGQAAASMVGSAVKAFASPSFDVQTAQTNIGNMVPKGGDIAAVQAKAMAAAIQIQRANPGMTIGQGLAMVANLYSVDRDMDAVAALAPEYASDGYIMSHAQGGADANDELYAVLRSSEDLGKLNLLNKDGSINTTKATSFIDLYTRLIANSNGNLSAGGALTMIGQAGPGATQMSDLALERMIVAAQALGPSQVGTGINAMYQEFIGGKMSQATARSLFEAGVLPKYAMVNGKRLEMFGDDDKITKPFKYGIGQVMLPPGVLKDEQEALTDPIGWARDHLFAQYLNPDGSVKSGDQKVVDELIADLNRDFSRIPGMRLAGNAVFNEVVQSRQIHNANHLLSLEQLHSADAATANAQAKGVTAAFNALLTTMGGPAIPTITSRLHALAAGINELSDAAEKHPDVTLGADQAGAGVLAWLGLKAGARILPGALGRGAASLSRAFPELAALILAWEATGQGSEKRVDEWGKEIGLPEWMTDPHLLEHLLHGSNKPVVDAVNNQTRQLVTALKGGHTAMPSGPTSPAPATSMPMPGQAAMSP